jgi:transcriptional regulator GlxA family with amidase domain
VHADDARPDARASAAEPAFTYDPRLARVKAHLDQHISEPLSLGDAARLAGMGRRYFSTFFHQATGMRFRDWSARTRVARAKELLGGANLSVSRVAYAVGFRGVRAFERAFKKHAGLTPFEYKKRVRSRGRRGRTRDK